MGAFISVYFSGFAGRFFSPYFGLMGNFRLT